VKAAKFTFTARNPAQNGAQAIERAQAPNENQLLPSCEVFTREDHADQSNGSLVYQINTAV
jgi:hypothetical protein